LLATPSRAAVPERRSEGFGSAEVFTSVTRVAIKDFPKKDPSMECIFSSWSELGKLPYFPQIADLIFSQSIMELFQCK
jgi:hypothetical protein